MAQSKYNRPKYYEQYGRIMQFNKNKDTYIHGWYPFVEGYSKDFIRSIVEEVEKKIDFTTAHCLDPFAGSGTTPLELQKLNIKCSSFEVSPFMYNLATTKMDTSYTVRDFDNHFNLMKQSLDNRNDDILDVLPPPNFRTIMEDERLSKWNFNKEVMKGLLDIKYALSRFTSTKYRNLFKIGLASILLDVSNVYRNGKCLSYKKNWQGIHISREEVHMKFLERLESAFKKDIVKLENYSRIKSQSLFSNKDLCVFGDVRTSLDRLEDNSIDLVITSPPYLNSRDYTDTYMIELRMLDYIQNYKDLQKLRENTLRSHVQVKWGKVDSLEIEELKSAVDLLEERKDEFWNESLLNMIKGYFKDMDTLFSILSRKVKANGKIYFNVANSAYHKIRIRTDEIVSEIAENNEFIVEEIREARKINPSSQQKKEIGKLIESVIVMKKKKA